MTKKVKEELSDDIYDALVDEYSKVVVIGVEEDKYALRYPNKIEFNVIRKSATEQNSTKPGAKERANELIQTTIESMIVWPDAETVKERSEVDGGLMSFISLQFVEFYANRASVEEKKRS